jgi:chromosome segregation ATPase
MEKMNEKEMSYLKDQHEIALKDLNRRLEESSSKRSDEEDMEMLRLELEEQRNVLESTLSKKTELENELNRKTRELDSKENALNESSKRISEMQIMLSESSKTSERETESLREAFLEEQQKRAQQAQQLESLQNKWRGAENELHRLSSELEIASKKEQSAVESSNNLQDTLERVRLF